MAERDACQCESPVRVESVEVWKKLGGTNISTFFLLCLYGEKERGLLLTVKLHQYLGLGDGHLMMPSPFPDVGKSVPRVLLEWSGFDSF